MKIEHIPFTQKVKPTIEEFADEQERLYGTVLTMLIEEQDPNGEYFSDQRKYLAHFKNFNVEGLRGIDTIKGYGSTPEDAIQHYASIIEGRTLKENCRDGIKLEVPKLKY